jgi:preprotein translocase subunit SecE
MGRLKRKKTSGAKKKKKRKASLATSARVQTANDADNKKAALTTARDKDTAVAKTVPTKKQSQVASVAPSEPKVNFINSSLQFLREVKIELKKVTWPSRKRTIGSTVVVIAWVMLRSLFLGAVDIGLSSLIRAVLQ